MTKLKHKTPCRECPFRRAAPNGWLGSSNPDEFVMATTSEAHMPCHMAINYSKPDWQEKQMANAAHCAGSLIFLKNQCKLPRDPALAAMIAAVKVDTETVFHFPQQFRDHHKKPLGSN